MNLIRKELVTLEKGSPKFKKLVIRRDKLWNQFRDVVEINAQARTGEVFTGQGSTLRELAAHLENPALRGASDFAAKVWNIPVRALISGDAALTQMSFKGHKVAAQVRRAIREGKTVREIGLLGQGVKGSKFNLLQRNQALEDSLYYLYRRDWGPLAKAMGIDKALRKPVVDNLFLFMRTRVNILKNYVDNSPFGIVSVIDQSIRAGGLDAKSFARFVNGTALHFGLYQFAKTRGGRWHGPSLNRQERKRRQARGIPELYYEDKNGKVHDMTNIAPLTPIVALVATIQDAEARGTLGRGLDENMKIAMGAMTKSVVEDAIYSDFKMIQRLTERMSEKGEDAEGYTSQALRTDLGKFVTGRGIPNILRETKQSGKLLGVPVPGLEPDRSVVEPTGNFAQTLKQQFASDIPGLRPPVLRISPLTGNPVVRKKRYTPFNPKFWTEGTTPGATLPENENRVIKELQRVKGS